MKKLLLAWMLAALSSMSNMSAIETILTIPSSVVPNDISGKLYLPEKIANAYPLVILVPGTGPSSYDGYFKYNGRAGSIADLYGRELNKRGAAFFRYNTIGVSTSKESPFFDSVDRKVFTLNTPANQVKYLQEIVEYFRNKYMGRFNRIIILGESEGTIISTLAVDRKKVNVDGLILTGYVNTTLKEVIEWQLSGESSMVNYCWSFDADKDGQVSEEEYEEDPYGEIPVYYNNAAFDQLDLTRDGKLSADDFEIALRSRKEMLFSAIERGDDDWIYNNYYRVPSAWFREHFALEKNMDRMLRLSIPVIILHGQYDSHVPVSGVMELKELFAKHKKGNLSVTVIPDHDHSLNLYEYVLEGKISAGMQRLFDTIGFFR